MKKTIFTLMLSSFLLILSSCWRDMCFKIPSLKMVIDIERIDLNRFRVYIRKENTNIVDDYIDIKYGLSDIPTIQLVVPAHESNRIFVIDRFHDIEAINSSEFNFFILSPEGIDNDGLPTVEKLDRLNKVLAQIDSVRDSIPSTTIQLNSRLRDISIWQNGIYKGVIQEERQ